MIWEQVLFLNPLPFRFASVIYLLKINSLYCTSWRKFIFSHMEKKKYCWTLPIWPFSDLSSQSETAHSISPRSFTLRSTIWFIRRLSISAYFFSLVFRSPFFLHKRFFQIALLVWQHPFTMCCCWASHIAWIMAVVGECVFLYPNFTYMSCF